MLAILKVVLIEFQPHNEIHLNVLPFFAYIFIGSIAIEMPVVLKMLKCFPEHFILHFEKRRAAT